MAARQTKERQDSRIGFERRAPNGEDNVYQYVGPFHANGPQFRLEITD